MLNMTRRSLAAVLAFALLALSLAPAQAQESTMPTEYAFDVTKIELCTDSTCTTAVVLGEGSQRFDLGSGQLSAGQSAGAFISDFSLTANQTYTHLRVTHSRAIDMTATAPTETATGGTLCVTGGDGIVTASSTTEAAAVVTSTTTPPATSQTFVVPNTDANNAPGGLAATYAAEGIVLIDDTTLAITKALTAPFTTGSSVPAIDAAAGIVPVHRQAQVEPAGHHAQRLGDAQIDPVAAE